MKTIQETNEYKSIAHIKSMVGQLRHIDNYFEETVGTYIIDDTLGELVEGPRGEKPVFSKEFVQNNILFLDMESLIERYKDKEFNGEHFDEERVRFVENEYDKFRKTLQSEEVRIERQELFPTGGLWNYKKRQEEEKYTAYIYTIFCGDYKMSIGIEEPKTTEFATRSLNFLHMNRKLNPNVEKVELKDVEIGTRNLLSSCVRFFDLNVHPEINKNAYVHYEDTARYRTEKELERLQAIHFVKRYGKLSEMIKNPMAIHSIIKEDTKQSMELGFAMLSETFIKDNIGYVDMELLEAQCNKGVKRTKPYMERLEFIKQVHEDFQKEFLKNGIQDSELQVWHPSGWERNVKTASCGSFSIMMPEGRSKLWKIESHASILKSLISKFNADVLERVNEYVRVKKYDLLYEKQMTNMNALNRKLKIANNHDRVEQLTVLLGDKYLADETVAYADFAFFQLPESVLSKMVEGTGEYKSWVFNFEQRRGFVQMLDLKEIVDNVYKYLGAELPNNKTYENMIGIQYKDDKGKIQSVVYDPCEQKEISLQEMIEKTMSLDQISNMDISISELYDRQVNENLRNAAKKQNSELENAKSYQRVIDDIGHKFLLSKKTVDKIQRLQKKINMIEMAYDPTFGENDREK